MEVMPLTFTKPNYEQKLLEQLQGEVFHLTSKDAYEKIVKDGFIFNNKDGRFHLNTGSGRSYGNSQGYVCLIDLRNSNKETIAETKKQYSFLSPGWFSTHKDTYIEFNLAYFILDSRFYRNLVPNYRGCPEGKYTQIVPKTEVWYKDKLPLTHIMKVLIVHIEQPLGPMARMVREANSLTIEKLKGE